MKEGRYEGGVNVICELGNAHKILFSKSGWMKLLKFARSSCKMILKQFLKK